MNLRSFGGSPVFAYRQSMRSRCFFTFRLVLAFMLIIFPALVSYRFGPDSGLLRAVGIGVVGGCLAWFLP